MTTPKTVALLIFLIVATFAALFSAQPAEFALSRNGLAHGELWRLFTGHFVHFSTQHLLANLAALALLLFLIPAPPTNRWQIAWLTVFTPLLLSTGLYLLRPDLASYGGLSGWLSALFLWIALDYVQRPNPLRHIFLASIALFALKIIIECTAKTSLFASFQNGIVVEPAAHAFGAASGAAGFLIRTPRSSWGTNSPCEVRLS